MKKFNLVFLYNLLVSQKNERPSLGPKNAFSHKVGFTLQYNLNISIMFLASDIISKSQTLALFFLL